FVCSSQNGRPSLRLSGRGVPPPKVPQIEPRATKLLGTPVVFEWSGSNTLRYKIRLPGPHGQIWEQESLPRKAFAYPSSAPALEPGVSYTWELEPTGQPMQQTEFQLLPPADAARVRESLGLLSPGSLPGYSASSVAM